MKVKQVLIIISVAIIFSIIGYRLSISQIGSFNSVITSGQEHHSPPSVVIEPGSGVEAASYIIFHDNEPTKNYYAKNGDTGEIVKSSDNASEVIQYAIDQLTSGGKIFIKAGTYMITSTIIVNQQNIWIQGENMGATILQGSGNIDLIKLSMPDGLNELHQFHLSNLHLKGESESVGGHLINGLDLTVNDRLTRCLIERVLFENVPDGKWAIALRNPEMFDIKHSKVWKIANQTVSGGGGAVLIQSYGYPVGNVVLFRNIFTPRGAKTNVTHLKLQSEVTNGVSIKRIRAIANHFHGKSGTQTNLIGVLTDTSGGTIQDLTFHANSFETPTKALSLNGSSGKLLKRIYIEGNNFYKHEETVESGQVFIVMNQYVKNVHIIDNTFYAKSGSGAKGVIDENTGTTNPNRIEGNVFVNVDTPIIPSGSTVIRENVGYVSENSGSQTVANNENIAHELASTPTSVTLTSANATYDGEPVIVSATSMDDTNIQAGVYWANGTAITDDVILVYWYAEV